MKNRKHTLLVPIIFLLAIFLFPTFITNTRPIPLKDKLNGNPSVECNKKHSIQLYTDAIIEEELIKKEFIEQVNTNFNLIDFILFQSKIFAVKEKVFALNESLILNFSDSGKSILIKINRFLI